MAMLEQFAWVGLALIVALTVAGMTLISEVQKHPTVARLFWLRLMCFVALFPITFFVQWPDDVVYYYCIGAITALICMSDIIYFASAQKNGAGVTTRIEPLVVLVTFVAWTGLHPEVLNEYLAHPSIGISIAACFGLAGFCALWMRKSSVSMATLRTMFPVIFMGAALVMLGKTAMDIAEHKIDAIIVYSALQCGALIVMYQLLSRFNVVERIAFKPSRALLMSAFWMAILSLLHIGSKNLAYTYVDNPAYVTVVGLSAPFMISVWYRFTGRRDDAQVWAGFGIVISACILIVLTQF